MTPKISIIVPVYNVERYLKRCIDSILNQTFKEFELILVDDGSEDKSLEICREYEKYDDRIKVIHKSNGGLSSARNAGLDIAKGKYIGFVDSDDWIKSNMYELLYSKITQQDADIAMCRALRIEKGDRFALRSFNGDDEKIFNSFQILKELFLDLLDCSACTKLYKRSLYKNIRFPINKTNEDFAVLYKIFNLSTKVVYIKDLLYIYEMREDSITTKKFSIKNFDRYHNAKESYEYSLEHLPKLKRETQYYYLYIAYCVLKQLLIENHYLTYQKEYKELLMVLRKNIINIVTNKYFNNRFKLSFFYIMIFPKLYLKRHLNK